MVFGPGGNAVCFWWDVRVYTVVFGRRSVARTWPEDGVCRYEVTSVSIMQLCREPGMNIPDDFVSVAVVVVVVVVDAWDTLFLGEEEIFGVFEGRAWGVGGG